MLKLSSRVLLLSALVALAACSNSPKKGAMSEQEYYNAAQKSIKSGNFNSAADQLVQLESHYPVGSYTQQAQLELIYARYKNVDYGGAAAAADRFIRLHPAHPQTDYAYYLRGLANYEAGNDSFARYMPTNQAHRDLGATRESFNDFRELLTRFPDSEYAADARQRMIFLRNQLAEAEMHAARFYVRRGAPLAALNRARWVVENYQGTPVMPEALATVAWAQSKLGLNDVATQSLELLKLNYPQYKDVNKAAELGQALGARREGPSWLNIMSFGLLGSDGH